ncbi:hypothetical protein MAP00_004942 [Monascus purpureus]|nr:hypothetical protein MAP00_004942 [Monascus purpureus]
MDLLSTLPNFPTKPYAHILPSLEKNRISTVDLVTLDTLEIAKRAHVPPADVRRLCVHLIQALHQDVGFERKQSTPESNLCDVEPSSSIDIEATIEPGPSTKLDLAEWDSISTLDPALDALLGGGILAEYVTEVTGESGSGKTQFLLSLLLSVQLPRPRGLGKRAIYVSTEAPLSTLRLSQLLECHPYLSSLPPRGSRPSLQNILSINAMDLETQDHILNYQLPVAVSRYNVGLVVIDSITANYRAEHSSDNVGALSARSGELARLGQMLRNLAVKEHIAVVVANQVSDRFDSFEVGSVGSHMFSGNTSTTRESGTASPLPKAGAEGGGGAAAVRGGTRVNSESNVGFLSPSSAHAMIPSSSPAAAFPSSPYGEEDPQFDGSYLVGNPVRNEILSLLRQQRFFTGWGDMPSPSPCLSPSPGPGLPPIHIHQRPSHKTPALGLVWSTQIACRIALKKEEQVTSTMVDMPRTSASVSVSTERAGQAHPDIREEKEEKEIPSNNNGDDSGAKDDKSKPAIETRTRRKMKLVFAPWTAGFEITGDGVDHEGFGDEIQFEIWKGGVRSV